jgi:quercetin dioxygenase-like cupin family protein
LLVISGVGWTQCQGGPVKEIRAGDVIWCPPNHKHWHGATSTTAMTHIAVQEVLDGKAVTWMEHVPDDQYRKGPERNA